MQRALTVIAILLCLTSAAHGAAPFVRITQTNGIVGSGTVIARGPDGRLLVLTCGACWRPGSAFRVEIERRTWVDAEALRVDPALDLGLLAVTHPPLTRMISPADAPPLPGTVVTVNGWNCLGALRRGQRWDGATIKLHIQPADQGSAVDFQGRLIGVLRSRPGQAMTPLPSIKGFIADVLAPPDPPPPNPPAPPGENPATTAPPASPPPAATPDPQPRIIQITGQPGPPGLPGRNGRDGQPGEPGPAPDLAPVKSKLDKALSVAGTALSVASWLGITGATGGIGGLILGGIALWRTVRRGRQKSGPGPPVAKPVPTQREKPPPPPAPPKKASPPAGSTSPPIVITTESPPPPQTVTTETRFVPFERDTTAEAYAYAVAEIGKKYPGSIANFQAMEGLKNQYLAAKGLNPRT